MAMQFIPNSPRPPRGTICNFPVGIEVMMLAQEVYGTCILAAVMRHDNLRRELVFAGTKA